MRLAPLTGSVLLGLVSIQSANAASIYAGEAKAATVCSQGHGIRTPSADAPFPPLAGRDVEYLKTAILKTYKSYLLAKQEIDKIK